MISKSFLIMSAASLSAMLLILIVFAVAVYSAPSSDIGSIEKVSSSGISCYEKMLGYARIGAYQDEETFNSALFYCNSRSRL